MGVGEKTIAQRTKDMVSCKTILCLSTVACSFYPIRKCQSFLMGFTKKRQTSRTLFIKREDSCLPLRGETIPIVFLQGDEYKVVSPPLFLVLNQLED